MPGEAPPVQPVLNLEAIMAMAREQAARAAAEKIELDMRRSVLRFASVLCSCRYPAWPVHGDVTPPQASCMIHGGVMVSFNGSEVL